MEKQGHLLYFGCVRRITLNVTCNVNTLIVLCSRKVSTLWTLHLFLLFSKKWVPGLAAEDSSNVLYKKMETYLKSLKAALETTVMYVRVCTRVSSFVIACIWLCQGWHYARRVIQLNSNTSVHTRLQLNRFTCVRIHAVRYFYHRMNVQTEDCVSKLILVQKVLGKLCSVLCIKRFKISCRPTSR